MRPIELKTKILLDSGDPKETEQALNLLGFLDGQTTNPTLVSKSPNVAEKIANGLKFTKKELANEYKSIIEDIKAVIPQGLISIEVYADSKTTAKEIIKESLEINKWINNAFIKLPITPQGLEAASVLSKQGVNLNLTLCFSQEQAAAVYAATIGATAEVFISPFQGRLDDNCKDGTDLIMNIQRMYAHSDHHVKIVTASIRDYHHFLYALYLKPEFVTVPLSIIKEWSEKNLELPAVDISEDQFKDKAQYFKDINNACIVGISYKEIDLNQDWTTFNIENELTDQGLLKFSSDWNNLLN